MLCFAHKRVKYHVCLIHSMSVSSIGGFRALRKLSNASWIISFRYRMRELELKYTRQHKLSQKYETDATVSEDETVTTVSHQIWRRSKDKSYRSLHQLSNVSWIISFRYWTRELEPKYPRQYKLSRKCETHNPVSAIELLTTRFLTVFWLHNCLRSTINVGR